MPKCTFDPKAFIGPVGMFHCPECGQMVVAGFSHPPEDDNDFEFIYNEPEDDEGSVEKSLLINNYEGDDV